MYMFVLVTLIVALIGIYTQVFNMQTAHMAAHETGIAQAMMDWHATATGLAQNAVTPALVTATGCSLTQGFVNTAIAGAPPFCSYLNSAGKDPHTGLIYISYTPTASVTSPALLPTCSSDPIAGIPPCVTGLPQGYGGLSNLGFYSMTYQVTAGSAIQNYVLTFIPNPGTPANGMPSFLCLPGAIGLSACGQQIDIGMNDLMAQIKHRGVSTFAYGTVGTCAPTGTPTCPTGAQLVTPPVPDPSVPPIMKTLAYPVPTIVPTGAFGIISQINLCTSC